jgi:ribosome-associated protein
LKLEALLRRAALAALAKKASDVVILDVRPVSSFTDYFLIASGGNQKQILAMADAVEQALREERLRPAHLEGYPSREWILMDYGPFVVHLFTPRTRAFYDLERLWGGATRTEVAG